MTQLNTDDHIWSQETL